MDDDAMNDTALHGKPLSDLRQLVLEQELQRRGLPASGNRPELIDRLKNAIRAEDASTGFMWDITDASGKASAPRARAGHGLVAHCNRLYVFGGFSMVAFPDRRDFDIGNRPPSVQGPHFNSVHEYSMDTKTWTELRPVTENNAIAPHPQPCARRHASIVVHGCSLFVYGGFDANDNVLSDMWEFDLQKHSWNLVQYGVAHSDTPVGRAEHTAIVYLNRMVVFGGYDGKRKLSDTYVFDFATKEWTAPNRAVHNAPSRRCKHTAVLHEKRMYVLGGFQFNNGENYALTDMHMLDLDTFVWSKISMGPGCPQALQGHKAVVANGKMYVVGGKVRISSGTSVGPGGEQREQRSTGLNSRVFCYNFDSFRWSVVQVAGAGPAPRQLHAAVAVRRRNNVYSIFMFGGTDKQKTHYYDDLCEVRASEVPVDNPCATCSSTGMLLDNPRFSDVRFVVGGQTVHAHRAILYSRSEYFRKMFESQMRESTAMEIPIPGVAHAVFLAVMEYLYTKHVNLRGGQHAVDVLKAADMFHLDGLRALCVVKVEQAINVDNVTIVCELADSVNTETLKQFCFNFIIQNFKSVIATTSFHNLMRDDPGGLGKEILEAFADSNGGSYHSTAHKRARK